METQRCRDQTSLFARDIVVTVSSGKRRLHFLWSRYHRYICLCFFPFHNMTWSLRTEQVELRSRMGTVRSDNVMLLILSGTLVKFHWMNHQMYIAHKCEWKSKCQHDSCRNSSSKQCREIHNTGLMHKAGVLQSKTYVTPPHSVRGQADRRNAARSLMLHMKPTMLHCDVDRDQRTARHLREWTCTEH